MFKPHWKFFVFLGCSAIWLLTLNQMLWPTPDEYFYDTITRSYDAAAHGAIAWKDINTEHIGLVALFGYVVDQVLQTNNLYFTRLVIVGFALGFITILYLIPPHLGFTSRDRMWLLWVLPLVTGFWMFGIRYMLDIPATFAIALLIWFLLRRAPAWQIGFGLMFVLLIKEYYWFLMLPMIALPVFLDHLLSPALWTKRLLRLGYDAGLIMLPSIVVIVVMLDLNIFPYPRLLDTSLSAVFGDYYTIANRFLGTLLGHSITVTDQLITLINPTETTTAVIQAESTVVQEVAPVISQAEPTLTQIGQTGQILTEQAGALQTTGRTIQGIVQAQHPFANSIFIKRLWLVYRSNFSETDVNIFLLTLTIFGAMKSVQRVVRGFKKHYTQVRPDVIFLILFAIFAYFNYHQADFTHGFRITLPITLCLVYFTARAVQMLLVKPRPWVPATWLGLVGLSLFGYWYTSDNVVSTALTEQLFLQTILSYKPVIYIGIFAACAVAFVWIIIRSQWRWQRGTLFGLMIVLTVMKFGPVFAEYAFRSGANHYDYGAALAAPILEELRRGDTSTNIVKFYGNMNPYRLQYYTNDPLIANDQVTPSIRKFSVIYPKRYYGGAITSDLMTTLDENQIDYVFANYTYSEAAETDYETMQNLVVLNPDRFTVIAEQKYNTQIEWQIYQYHSE